MDRNVYRILTARIWCLSSNPSPSFQLSPPSAAPFAQLVKKTMVVSSNPPIPLPPLPHPPVRYLAWQSAASTDGKDSLSHPPTPPVSPLPLPLPPHCQVLDEAERSLHDALCVVRCLISKRFLIAGGGAPEIEVSRQLTAWSKELEGKESYCARGFAEAFEVRGGASCMRGLAWGIEGREGMGGSGEGEVVAESSAMLTGRWQWVYRCRKRSGVVVSGQRAGQLLQQ